MNDTPFETDLYRQLHPFFAEHQYTLLTEKKQFRKNTATGFQNAIFSPSFYGDETWLEVNFGCRNEQIEQIAQQFLNNLRDYRPDANTLIISIGKFTDVKYFRYKITTTDDLIDVCDQIQDFFVERGFGFLDESGALPTLDRILNHQPNQPCKYVYNQTHRCYKALIAARLTHNPRFDGLTDAYRHLMMRQTQNAYEQQNFERLVAYLQHYSAN
jgi:hypothetical protein